MKVLLNFFSRKNIIIFSFILCCILLLARQKITGGISGGDSINYYSYMHSILIDHDLDFENEYNHFSKSSSKFTGHKKLHTAPKRHPITNKYPMKQPIGLIISWAPFFLLGHLIAFLTYFLTGNFSYLSGYTQIEYYFTSLSAVVYSFTAFYLIYKFVLRFLSNENNNAFLSCTLAALATPITYYIIFLPTFAHAISLFWCCLFAVFFIEKWEDEKLNYLTFAIGGLFFGMAVITRFQNFIILIIPVIFYLYDLFNKNKRVKFLFFKTLIFLLFFLMVLYPQLYVNKVLHGSLLSSGNVNLGFPYLLNPKIFYVLFSLEKGLFIWTPLTLFSLIGVFLIKNKKIMISMALFFAIQLYTVSSYYYFNQGDSFSIRMLANCTFVFALGLSELISRYKKNKLLLYSVSAFFVLLNFTLMILFAFRIIGKPYGFIWKSTFY